MQFDNQEISSIQYYEDEGPSRLGFFIISIFILFFGVVVNKYKEKNLRRQRHRYNDDEIDSQLLSECISETFKQIGSIVMLILGFILVAIEELNDRKNQANVNQNQQPVPTLKKSNPMYYTLPYKEQIEKVYDIEWLDSSELYSYDVIKFINENLKCHICFQLMKEAVELNCKHVLCRDCFQNNIIKSSINPRCPFCMERCSSSVSQTRRAKILTHLANTLQLKCFYCVEQQKYQFSFNGVNINRFFVCQHLNDHISGQLIKDYIYLCRNHKWNCTKSFYDLNNAIQHENNCRHQLIRCCKCMKLYGFGLTTHICRPQDFLNKIEVQPNYNFTFKAPIEYQVRCFLETNWRWQVEAFFLCKTKEFTIFIFDNQFLKENFTELFQQLGYFCEELKKQPQLTVSSDKNVKSYLEVERSHKTNSRPEYQEFRTLGGSLIEEEQKSYQPTIQSKNSSIYQPNIPTKERYEWTEFKNCYDEEQKPFNKPKSVYDLVRPSLSLTYDSQYLLKKNCSLFVAGILAHHESDAIDKIQRELSLYGEIINIKILGIGKTGKYYGIIKYSTAIEAQQMLDRTKKGGYFKSGSFSCFIKIDEKSQKKYK